MLHGDRGRGCCHYYIVNKTMMLAAQHLTWRPSASSIFRSSSSRAVLRQQHSPRRSLLLRPLQSAQPPDAAGAGEAEEAEFDGLLPEEDYEVPGGYMEAMNSNTKLGKAVRAAVEELEHLGDLETEVLQQCDDLLKKLGMKGSLFGSSPPPRAKQQDSSSSGTDLQSEE